MFAGVISRDAGTPWPETGMTSELWLARPVAPFPISRLVATQPGVLFSALLDPQTPHGGDPLPHVIVWRGVTYLEDGHHRVMRAVINGQRRIRARYLVLV